MDQAVGVQLEYTFNGAKWLEMFFLLGVAGWRHRWTARLVDLCCWAFIRCNKVHKTLQVV